MRFSIWFCNWRSHHMATPLRAHTAYTVSHCSATLLVADALHRYAPARYARWTSFLAVLSSCTCHNSCFEDLHFVHIRIYIKLWQSVFGPTTFVKTLYAIRHLTRSAECNLTRLADCNSCCLMRSRWQGRVYTYSVGRSRSPSC